MNKIFYEKGLQDISLAMSYGIYSLVNLYDYRTHKCFSNNECSNVNCYRLHLLSQLPYVLRNKDNLKNPNRVKPDINTVKYLIPIIVYVNYDLTIKDLVILVGGNYALFELRNDKFTSIEYKSYDYKDSVYYNVVNKYKNLFRKYFTDKFINQFENFTLNNLLDSYFLSVNPRISAFSEKHLLMLKNLLMFFKDSPVDVILNSSKTNEKLNKHFDNWEELFSYIYDFKSKAFLYKVNKHFLVEFEKLNGMRGEFSLRNLLRFNETKYYLESDLKYLGLAYQSYEYEDNNSSLIKEIEYMRLLSANK